MISSISRYQRQPFPSPFPCVESSSTRRLGLPGVFRNSIANTQKMWDGIFVAPHKEACTCANESRGRSETQNWKSANVAFQFEPPPPPLWSRSVKRQPSPYCWEKSLLNLPRFKSDDETVFLNKYLISTLYLQLCSNCKNKHHLPKCLPFLIGKCSFPRRSFCK